MTVAMVAQVAKHLDGSSAVGQFLRRLDVAGIVDELCPIRDVADLTHGQVVEVLIANRLTAPAPLVRVADWAGKWAVEEVFGVAAGLLNDDRLARTLDAIAPDLEQLVGTVGAAAICEFGIDVSRCHGDMTSMPLLGDYRDQFGEYPQVKYGHPKDRRVDLKQVQTGITVAGDGGIPVLSKVYSGGAGEFERWPQLLSAWFVQRCAPERVRGPGPSVDTEAWLQQWRAMTPEQRAAVGQEPWTLSGWLYYFDPTEEGMGEDRSWWWWDAGSDGAGTVGCRSPRPAGRSAAVRCPG